MATYTMQLKAYIEMFSQEKDGLNIRERIEKGRPHLFDFDYPFFDDDYKKAFETNIIRYFYTREIGSETEELFKFRLETWLNINMPYYNELFKSEQLEYDPLTNAQMLTAHEQLNDKGKVDERQTNQTSQTDGKGTSTSDGKSTGKNKQDSSSTGKTSDDNFSRKVASDNPDSRLALTTKEGKGVIEYASDIDENKTDNKGTTSGDTKANSDSTNTSHVDSEDTTHVDSSADQKDNLKSNTNEVEHYLQRRYGKIGSESYAKLVQEYRSALLRIEVQIHREMQELFMLVY